MLAVFAFGAAFADPEKSRDRLAVKWPSEALAEWLLDGCSGMVQGSISEGRGSIAIIAFGEFERSILRAVTVYQRIWLSLN